MTSVIVSSLDAAACAYGRCKPGYVISILDSDDAVPEPFRQLPADRHLRLDPAACEKMMAPAILDFAAKWAESDEDILIHCHRGVARSMAIAYILLCAREHGECEEKIAARLRAAAPHADPNLRLVSEADRLLNREDRMVGAILDLCPCCSTVCAPVVTLPVAP
ncbi:hypothetical protein [Hyphococcus sp.]|uniref:hypothetical protein n=1 Tax=Hyphococcus sp. TaxID=2038636 RepID=UPI003D114D62